MNGEGTLSLPADQVIFTFTMHKGFDLDEGELAQLCGILGLDGMDELIRLAGGVASGRRRESNEHDYRSIDNVLLPHIEALVFFGNFSQPELVFPNSEELSFDLAESNAALKGSRITYFAVWDGEGSKHKRFEIELEAKIILEVVPGAVCEDFESIEDEVLRRELRECRNMFNFGVRGLDLDDNEVLDHECRVESI